jgi:hypothetical protein
MTQTVDDLLRKNLATFGEHDAKQRRAMMSKDLEGKWRVHRS